MERGELMHAREDRRDGWCPEHDAKIIELRAIGMGWIEIGLHVNRTDDACAARYRKILPKSKRPRIYGKGDRWSYQETLRFEELVQQNLRPGVIAKILSKPQKSVYNKIQYGKYPRTSPATVEPRPWAPPHLFEDRDRRAKAVRDLTSTLCGDPAPGQSALDKKQGAFA